MPGHKRRLSNDDLFAEIYGIDITEIDGFDNLHDAKGMIKEAQERAARCFGSDETYFLVNGSTAGILAAVCGTVTTGDAVIMASNCHRSVYNAVMLSGATPFVITPEKEELFDTYGGIDPNDVLSALEAVRTSFSDNNKAAYRTAVVITSPTYEGITSDIPAISGICHEKGAVLIVDAAHGAHFSFSGYFPQSAFASGADVVIEGIHKTLPAMTQTALIHMKKNCPSKDRIRTMLSVFETSSPSYVLMASIDSMTDLLEEKKEELFDAYTARLDRLYDRAEAFEHLGILCSRNLTAAGSYDHDRSKIVVRDMTGSLSGRELSDMLLDRYGIRAEMASDTYVILMTGIADTDEGFERLENALCDIDMYLGSDGIRSIKHKTVKRENSGPEKIRILDNNMKTALFTGDREYIPVERAKGRISADFVIIYPPGVPVTIPGEKITKEAVDRILEAEKNGLKILGLKDKEIEVLWERSST